MKTATHHNNIHNNTYKVLLLGDSGCGKTCVMMRYCNNSFSASFITTIGIDFKIKIVGDTKLQIWDTAGQERFRTITESYYKHTNAVIIMYDITDKDTFDNIHYWIKQITKSIYSQDNVVKILVGNKTDLNDQRIISFDEGFELAKKYDMPFFETSAKNGDNVDNLFDKIVKDLNDHNNHNKKTQNSEKIKINQNHLLFDKKQSCC